MDIERRSDPFGFQRFSACVWRWAKKNNRGRSEQGLLSQVFATFSPFFCPTFLNLRSKYGNSKDGGVNFLDARGVCEGFPRVRPNTQEEKKILVIFFWSKFSSTFLRAQNFC